MTLALERVFITRGTRQVLAGVGLQLRAGEVVGLLGANGAGKSSLLGVLAGDLPVQSGTASLDGRALKSVPWREQSRRRAVLTQQPGLQFDLGVADLVAMGAYPFPELTAGAVAALVRQALTCTDMLEQADRRYPDLSGGEQQRVHFARALVQVRAGAQPGVARYLLLDEPTASLDPAHQQRLL